jgi:microcin C transport system substrate-binding protein
MLELSNDTHKIAFWNEFGRPKLGPRYALGVVDTWWIDAAKSAALKRGAAN